MAVMFFWKDFVDEANDRVAVAISKDILSSDEAIVAVLGHEMHELNNLRRLFLERGDGGMAARELSLLVNPGRPGNLHDQAWDAADRFVLAMRKSRVTP